MLALHGELEVDGNFWVASNRAIYIEPKPTSANRRWGPIKTKRIPYEWVRDLSEQRRGGCVERTLRITNDRGNMEISGNFKVLLSAKLTEVILEQLAARK